MVLFDTSALYSQIVARHTQFIIMDNPQNLLILVVKKLGEIFASTTIQFPTLFSQADMYQY